MPSCEVIGTLTQCMVDRFREKIHACSLDVALHFTSCYMLLHIGGGGLPGGTRCFNRVPRALLVILNGPKQPPDPILTVF